jgi:hypothetical protein
MPVHCFPRSLQVAFVLQTEPVGQSLFVLQDFVQNELPLESPQQSSPGVMHSTGMLPPTDPQPPLWLPLSGAQTYAPASPAVVSGAQAGVDA